MNEYEKQANDFLSDTNTEFKAEFLKHGFHFVDDTEERDIYKISLKRGNREFKFNFGQSLADSGLRLFYDKEKTKRTNHKNFEIPEKVRENLIKYKKEHKPLSYKATLKNWFEKEYFSLSGLYYDLGKTPNSYDVLSSLQCYELEDFINFCSEFGYNIDSIKAEKIYKAVLNEYNNLKMLYSNEELNKLAEIQ